MLAAVEDFNALVNLFHQGTKLTFKKGDLVTPPKGSPGGVFYVAKGLIKIHGVTKYGEKNLFMLRRTGDILGVNNIASNIKYKSVYSAIKPTTVFYIPRDQFIKFLHSNLPLTLPLLEITINMYLAAAERVVDLSFRSVRERLVSFLLFNAQRFGEMNDKDNSVVINLPLRHQDIAGCVCATRETISRELVTLEHQGLIQRSEKFKVTINDIEKLQKFID